VEKNEAGISLENSDGHEEGLQQKKGEQGQWMRWRKRRDQVHKGVIIFKVQTWHGGSVAHKTLGSS